MIAKHSPVKLFLMVTALVVLAFAPVFALQSATPTPSPAVEMPDLQMTVTPLIQAFLVVVNIFAIAGWRKFVMPKIPRVAILLAVYILPTLEASFAQFVGAHQWIWWQGLMMGGAANLLREWVTTFKPSLTEGK